MVNNHQPSDDIGMKLADLYKQWLMFYWPKYDPQAHRELSKTYVEDDRFKQYHEEIIAGGAVFVKDAICYHIV
jgi:hypothetical protein